MNKPKAPQSTRFAAIPAQLIDSGTFQKLSGSAAKVLICLCNFRDYYTNICWPSWSTLERDSGVSRSSIIRAISELESLHIVQVLEKGGGHKSARYRLLCFDPPITMEIAESEQQKPAKMVQAIRKAEGCQNETPEVSKWNPNNTNNEKVIPSTTHTTKNEGPLFTNTDPETENLRTLAAYTSRPAVNEYAAAGLTDRQAYSILHHLRHERIEKPGAFIHKVVNNHRKSKCDPLTCLCCTAKESPNETRAKIAAANEKAAQDAAAYREAITRQGDEIKNEVYAWYHSLDKDSDQFQQVHRFCAGKIAYRKYRQDRQISELGEKFREDLALFEALPTGVRTGYLIDMRAVYRRIDSGEDVALPDLSIEVEEEAANA